MSNPNELIGIVAVDPQRMENLVMIKPGKKDPLFFVTDGEFTTIILCFLNNKFQMMIGKLKC